MSEVTPIPDPLDELELLVVVDNETDTLSSIEADIPQLPELAGLLSRIPPSRDFNGTPGVCTFDQLCVACHGFSVLLTGRRGDTTSRVLFDVGPYSDVWLDNAERLAIDLSTIERLFLSHWHADHSGGFPGVIEAITNARRAAGLPDLIVDLHPDRPDQRGVLGPTGVIGLLPPEPTFDEITAAGGVIELYDEPHVVGDIFYGSGLIERVTAYETGLAGHHTFVGDDACRRHGSKGDG